MSKGKYYFSKSLQKGLNILALFNRTSPELTQSEIARKLGLNMTSTYRYINTLVEMGYLDKDPKTRGIRPSIRCALFCNHLLGATDHLRMIRETVDRIHRANNITIDVALSVNHTMVRLYHREAQETLTYRLPDHTQNCLHNTALGKAYLSGLPEEELEQTLSNIELVPRTEKTIVDRQHLLAELTHARQRKYVVADEEYLPGLISIGAPLCDSLSGKGIGAVSFDFSVLQHDAAAIKDNYSDLVIQTAASLSVLLPPGKMQGA